MKRKDTQKIVITAIMIGLIVIASFIPQIGFIKIGLVSITTVHIPVIIGIILVKDWRYSLVLGLTFGVLSFIQAFTGVGLDLLFVNPLVSIVPRVLMGLIGAACVKVLDNRTKPAIKYGITAFVSTLANTVFVFASLLIWHYTDVQAFALGQEYSGAFAMIGAILASVSIIEITIAVILSIIIGRVVDQIEKRA